MARFTAVRRHVLEHMPQPPGGMLACPALAPLENAPLPPPPLNTVTITSCNVPNLCPSSAWQVCAALCAAQHVRAHSLLLLDTALVALSREHAEAWRAATAAAEEAAGGEEACFQGAGGSCCMRCLDVGVWGRG